MERREHTRTRIWFPVTVRTGESSTVLGVSCDVSQTGMLVSAAGAVEAGSTVTLTLATPPDNPTMRVVHGHVVRCGKNEDDPDGLWPYRLAIELDGVFEELDGMVDEVVASSRRW